MAATRDPNWENSDEICEALVRHTEVSGFEVLEKNFIDNEREITCTVWCMIGPHAKDFCIMARQWLKDNGFTS